MLRLLEIYQYGRKNFLALLNVRSVAFKRLVLFRKDITRRCWGRGRVLLRRLGKGRYRSQQAAQELITYLREAISPHSLHLAWSVLTRSSAQSDCKSLTYDCQLAPPEVLRPIAEQQDAMVRGVLEKLLGYELDEDRWEQLGLPGPLSGCAVLST